MSVMIVLFSAGAILAILFLVAFLWSAKNGQYDDTFSPGVRMLFENEKQAEEPGENATQTLSR
jgi:cbb3-type cytochrome oxidase maturation protein